MDYVIKHKTLSDTIQARLSYDQWAENPRNGAPEDYHTQIVAWHPRTLVGDRHNYTTPETFLASVREGDMLRHLFIYQHGGIALSIRPFTDPFDSGQVGFVRLSAKRLAATGMDEKQAEEAINKEVKELQEWLNGEVFLLSVVEKPKPFGPESNLFNIGGLGPEDTEDSPLDAILVEALMEEGIAEDCITDPGSIPWTAGQT